MISVVDREASEKKEKGGNMNIRVELKLSNSEQCRKWAGLKADREEFKTTGEAGRREEKGKEDR
jgi:hypothetical protein